MSVKQDRSIDTLFALFHEKSKDDKNQKNHWSMDRVMMHAVSEIGEIWNAERKGTRAEVVEEVADSFNLLVVIAVRLNIDADELMAACHKKFNIVAERETSGITH